jgi:Flp pilus assembly protein TadB
MKNLTLLFLSVVVLASCSAPRQLENSTARKSEASSSAIADYGRQTPGAPVLLASAAGQPMVTASAKDVAAPQVKTYRELSRVEKKAVRQQIKSQVKAYIQSTKKADATQAAHAGGMDNDLKLAIIFGAIGLVGLIISGSVFQIIGGIALLIGVVFFVKWIIRQ